MKLHKLLTINGEPFDLINEDIRLNLFNAGRGLFTVKNADRLEGIVNFSMGFEAGALVPFFTGYIETGIKVDSKQRRIFCREYGGALNQVLPLNRRHCTLIEVLDIIGEKTTLQFKLPDQDYTRKTVSRVQWCGMGYGLLDQLGQLFDIPRFIWQQQRDGSVYVGSWDHSNHGTRKLDIPNEFLTAAATHSRVTIPTLEKLTPGVKFNDMFLSSVQQHGSEMTLNWHPYPWKLKGRF